MNKKCQNCGLEFFSYGSECPVCLSMNVEKIKKPCDKEDKGDKGDNKNNK